MNKRYDDLKSVMNMPKGTVEEQRAFINQVFRDVWPNLYIDEFYYDKQTIKAMYHDYHLVKSKLFCQILTAIFSLPYKEMTYYHGDNGKYVDPFPPIRIKLTQQQAFELRKMNVACSDFKTMMDIMANTTLSMKDETKAEIKKELYDSYKLTLASCMLKLSDTLNIATDIDMKKESTYLY